MKKTKIEAEQDVAVAEFESGSPDVKLSLTKIFGKDIFYRNITDRVKTFEDALKIYNASNPGEEFALPYSNPKNDFQRAQNAVAKMWVIIEVINEGWKADFKNTNQYKYYPFFKYVSGSGLSFDGFGHWDTAAACGVRFALETSDKAVYIGNQFTDIYNEFLN